MPSFEWKRVRVPKISIGFVAMRDIKLVEDDKSKNILSKSSEYSA